MKLKVINIEGKKNNDIEVSDKIFSLNPNKHMIQSLVEDALMECFGNKKELKFIRGYLDE